MRVQDEIDIDALPACVWDVTVDVERWPEWSPTFESVRRLDAGPLVVGSSAEIRQPRMRAATWTVTELMAGASFTWETRVMGMRMLATHVVTPLDLGARSVLRVETRGVVAWLLTPLTRDAIRGALKEENRGLKARCEGASAGN